MAWGQKNLKNAVHKMYAIFFQNNFHFRTMLIKIYRNFCGKSMILLIFVRVKPNRTMKITVFCRSLVYALTLGWKHF